MEDFSNKLRRRHQADPDVKEAEAASPAINNKGVIADLLNALGKGNKKTTSAAAAAAQTQTISVTVTKTVGAAVAAGTGNAAAGTGNAAVGTGNAA